MKKYRAVKYCENAAYDLLLWIVLIAGFFITLPIYTVATLPLILFLTAFFGIWITITMLNTWKTVRAFRTCYVVLGQDAITISQLCKEAEYRYGTTDFPPQGKGKWKVLAESFSPKSIQRYGYSKNLAKKSYFYYGNKRSEEVIFVLEGGKTIAFDTRLYDTALVEDLYKCTGRHLS